MIKISPRQIAAARELLDITQQQLADGCGVSTVSISRIEAGATQPHADTIRKIVRELTKRGIEFNNGTGIGVRLDYKKAAAYKAAQGDSPPVDPNLG
jgi:transcriptional regulator with XRE-family HTH domain